eukprot:249305_1
MVDKENELESDIAERLCWEVGAQVLVYSDTKTAFVVGTICDIHFDGGKEWLKVQYDGDQMKNVERYNKEIKIYSDDWMDMTALNTNTCTDHARDDIWVTLISDLIAYVLRFMVSWYIVVREWDVNHFDLGGKTFKSMEIVLDKCKVLNDKWGIQDTFESIVIRIGSFEEKHKIRARPLKESRHWMKNIM